MENHVDEVIDINSFKVINKSFNTLNDAGKITKAVKLETTQESLLGRIQRIELDKETNDLVVGDFRNTKRVLRFTKNGDFVRRYGQPGEGPGEYKDLLNFTLTPHGEVILLTSSKLMKFSKVGKLLIETRLNYLAKHLKCIGNLIYIQILRYRSNPEEKKAIIVLDLNFRQVNAIGNYDTRLEKMIYGLWESMATHNNTLYYINHYSLALNIYNTKTQRTARLKFPDRNNSSDSLWKKKTLSIDDEQEISNNLHRFLNIKSFNHHLFLFEICNKQRLYNVRLVNLQQKKTITFSRSCLTGQKTANDLYFYMIPGSFEKGIIGVFNDVEKFNLYKNRYPLLKEMQFNADENPVLTFFEFHNFDT